MFVNKVKKLVDGLAELRFNDPADIDKWKRGDTVLEFGKFFDKINRNQVRAGGNDLAELYIGGPQFFNGHSHLFRPRQFF